MKKFILNPNKILENEIDEEVTRVKALIINSNNEILLACLYNEYQFPGGHLEKGEDKEDGLLREVKEETGLTINKEELVPFMMIKHLSKNYSNSGKNRCNDIYYYVIKTNEKININNTNYTDYEKNGDFKLEYVKINDVEEKLIDNSNKYPTSKGITYEMLQVLYEYKNKYNLN